MHILPQLRRLEEKYQSELAVIGVHSAKFPSEQETENVRMAILRYEITHPVVNDSEFLVWQSYVCRAWPTLVFVDPEGKILGRHEGEISFDVLDRLIEDMVESFKVENRLSSHKLTYRLERQEGSVLSFPGAVLADWGNDRLFIADSNNNRILHIDLDGDLKGIIGGVTPGFQDGDYVLAEFNRPQGLALDGNLLYVADTENHAIRKVDLDERYVDTLVSNGRLSKGGDRGSRVGRMALNSPWDLTVHDGVLYIAMAGSHQIWRFDLVNGELMVHAGNGKENIVDGPAISAQLAQPSGIVSDDEYLYFVDSETSSVRFVGLGRDRFVGTVVGQGLFEFGDVDGRASEVRLQHPMALEHSHNMLYVADSYNHKIKKVDPVARTVITLFGTGKNGHHDGPGRSASFYEPSGLSIAGEKLFIADTNNNAIRVADLATQEVITLRIEGI